MVGLASPRVVTRGVGVRTVGAVRVVLVDGYRVVGVRLVGIRVGVGDVRVVGVRVLGARLVGTRAGCRAGADRVARGACGRDVDGALRRGDGLCTDRVGRGAGRDTEGREVGRLGATRGAGRVTDGLELGREPELRRWASSGSASSMPSRTKRNECGVLTMFPRARCTLVSAITIPTPGAAAGPALDGVAPFLYVSAKIAAATAGPLSRPRYMGSERRRHQRRARARVPKR